MGDIPSDETLRKITGEEEVRLLPFRSSDGHRASLLAVSPDGNLYSVKKRGYKIVDGKAVGGEWSAKPRAAGAGPNPSVHYRHMGRNGAMFLARLIAIAYLGDPPFPDAQAVFKGKRPTADNVEWMTQSKQLRTRPDRTSHRIVSVKITKGLADHVTERFGEAVSRDGLDYVVESLVRNKLGMKQLPTRRKHWRVEQEKKRWRNSKIIADAETGLHTLRGLALMHGLSMSQIANILRNAGVSLAEIKQRKRE